MRFFAALLLVSLGLLYGAAPIDFAPQLAKWRLVNMPLDISAFSLAEKRVVTTLIAASQQIESIYWRQSDPGGLGLLLRTKDRDLKRMLMINGGRFNLIDDNRPFIGTEAASAGRALYPRNVTASQIQEYVKKHPQLKDAIYSPYTVVIPYGDGMQAIPYDAMYAPWLTVAVDQLRKAAAESPDLQFANFLNLRAAALLNDDFYKSDLAWMDLKHPQVDLIMGPNETDLDGVLGVKTAYEAAVLIRDDAESAKLEVYQKALANLQASLPIDKRYLAEKSGKASPMEVVNSPFRTGDMLHGYQAVADTLPNDPRIHEAKGTKKIFFKNFMDARVRYVVVPLATQLMPSEQAGRVSENGYLTVVILHEIAHGLGPSFALVNGKKTDMRTAMGPIYGALEEAKADVTGMLCADWLMQNRVLDPSRAPEFYLSYVAGIFRSLRYGTAEAHGLAEMMEFNYLLEQNTIERSEGHFRVKLTQMPAAMAKLSHQLLQFEATGDKIGAEAWFGRYDRMTHELRASMEKTGDIPVDIEPVFSVPVLPR
jgi:hypothetical protein